MRLNWFIPAGNSLTQFDIYQASGQFFEKYKTIPDSVKIPYKDFMNFMGMMPMKFEILERGKEYGLFLPIPGGMVELIVMENTEESFGNSVGQSFFTVESTHLDREFEKHVLGEKS